VSKFKVGDLVQLSAAGKKRDSNWILARSGGFGLVVKALDQNHLYPIECYWSNESRVNKKHIFKEYELKRLKAKK